MGASVCVCTQCGLHVCQAHRWAVQKWLSRSRCHLVGTLTWAQSTCTWWGAHWCHLVCMTHQSKHDSDAPSLMSYYFDLFSVIALVHTLVYDTGWSALRRRYFDFWNAVDGVQEPHSQCSLQDHTTNISAERKVKLLFQNAFTSELFAPGYEGKPITDNSLATLVQHDIHKSLIAKLFPVITHSSINHSIIGVHHHCCTPSSYTVNSSQHTFSCSCTVNTTVLHWKPRLGYWKGCSYRVGRGQKKKTDNTPLSVWQDRQQPTRQDAEC